MKKRIWSGLSSIFVFLLCFAIIGNTTAMNYASTINGFLGISTSKLVAADNGSEGETIQFTTSFGELNGDNLKLLMEATYAQSIAEGNEGMVLLRNENQALPLSDKEMSVTLFGHAVMDPLYRNNSAGSSAYTSKEGVDLFKALKNAGFRVNEKLLKAYRSSKTARAGGGFNAQTGEALPWSLGEEKIEFYTDELRSTWENDYNDAAIVMFAREGGEGIELIMEDAAEGISQLALHQDERDLLQMIKDSGKFKKTIVLINSGNAMELGWLEEYGVDACLWIGCPGQKGFTSVVNLLTGAANPSGRLPDTYAVSSLSAPAVANNSGNNQTWSNLDYVLQNSTDVPGEASYYAVQAEGIYIGYKYYETRYEDTILGRYNADSTVGSIDGESWNYTKEVTYPFGFGLSYTTFDQHLDKVDVNDDTVTVTVTVTNTGSVAGKSVVQIYAQTPYGEYERQNKVEKSAIQLLNFGKTELLEPGAKQTLTIECDKYLLASYDYTAAKVYYLSEGDYYVAIGESAHDALNNVLAAKGATGMVDTYGKSTEGDSKKTYTWTEDFDAAKYRASQSTGVVVTNQFDDCDINYWIEGAVTYLSRSDWEGTYPVHATKLECTDEMIAELNGYHYVKPDDAPSISTYTQGANAGLQLASMANVAYDDDDIWDSFLDQMTIDEMASLLPDMDGSAAIASIGKPEVKVGDGPDGIGGLYNTYDKTLYGTKSEATCYTCEATLAATFNKELIANRGALMAEEAIYLGLMEIWSPGSNLHRTPFGGRNFEYYSEDAVMNYLCSIPEVQAMESRGVVAGIKHCAGNDQENNRIGIALFFNEQAFREGALRGFEGALAVAGGSSVMQGFNRLGLTGCSSSYAMNTGVIRNEWGMKGIIITDATSSVTTGYRASYVDQLVAGTDAYCIDFSGVSAQIISKQITSTDDGFLLGELRRAAKNNLYCTVNSPAMNGYSVNTKVIAITPWWQPVLQYVIWACVALTIIGLIGLTVCEIMNLIRKRRGVVQAVDRMKNRALGTWLSLAAGLLALASLVIFLIWAPGNNAMNALIPIALAAGIVAEILLFFFDISYLGVVATACFSAAFFTLVSNSVGSFVDALQGIVMFGDSTQVGIILAMSALMLVSILSSILSCFIKRRKK